MAIRHIEHYANTGDYVSQIGVLHFALNSGTNNRFMGRLFISPYSGHLLNSHYLHAMFPLGPDGTCLETNDFMEMPINRVSTADEDSREGTMQSAQNTQSIPNGHPRNIPIFTDPTLDRDGKTTVNIVDVDSEGDAASKTRETLKVKHVSRLWSYRNGAVPPDDTARRASTL
jgi:hypothetical protein